MEIWVFATNNNIGKNRTQGYYDVVVERIMAILQEMVLIVKKARK